MNLKNLEYFWRTSEQLRIVMNVEDSSVVMIWKIEWVYEWYNEKYNYVTSQKQIFLWLFNLFIAWWFDWLFHSSFKPLKISNLLFIPTLYTLYYIPFEILSTQNVNFLYHHYYTDLLLYSSLSLSPLPCYLHFSLSHSPSILIFLFQHSSFLKISSKCHS